MAELNSPQMNGVGPGGDRRAYFTGADVYGNPMYEWYSAQEDGTADDWEAAEMANIYDWNKSMFNNWYNSPAQLISRLEEAGMNPLFYLAQNAGNQPAQGPAGANAPNVKHANNKMSNILSASRNAADSLLATQLQALDYDIKRRQQEIDLERIDIEKGRLRNETNKTTAEINELGTRSRLNEAQIERLAHENNWTDEQVARAQVEIAKMNKEMDAMTVAMQEAGSRIDLNYATINKISHENKVLDALVTELAARTGLERQQVETEIAKIAEFQASADLKTAEIEVLKGQKVVLEKTAEGIEIKNEQDKTYGGWERVQGIIGGYIHSAAEAVNTVVNVKTGGAKAALDRASKGLAEEKSETLRDAREAAAEQRTDDAEYRRNAERIEELQDKMLEVSSDPSISETVRKNRQATYGAELRKLQERQRDITDSSARRARSDTHSNPTFTLDY